MQSALLVASALLAPMHTQESLSVIRESQLDATPRAWLPAGTWRTWVRDLEPSERQRLSAAQFVPWEVVRSDGTHEPEVVLSWDDPTPWTARRRPSRLAIDDRGTVYAISEHATRLFVLSGRDQLPIEHTLPGDSSLAVVHLEPEGFLQTSAGPHDERELWWSSIGPAGVADARPVPPRAASTEGVPSRFVRARDELVWCSSEDTLTALDLLTGEQRALPYADATALELERAVGGWLFARATGDAERLFHGELRLTNLATGESFSRPAHDTLAAWLPEGLLFLRAFHDPVDGRRVEVGEPLGVNGEFQRIDGRSLAFRARRGAPWRVLHLDATQPFEEAPLTPTALRISAALDDHTEQGIRALQSTELWLLVKQTSEARSAEAVALMDRLLRSEAGTNVKSHAASLLASGGSSRARGPLRAALAAAPTGSLQVRFASCLAAFMHPDDARAIEAAIPVETLPPGMRHGDAAVKVARALAIIGDEGSVAYLEALYERAPFELVLRALESVRSAPAFRAALAAARAE